MKNLKEWIAAQGVDASTLRPFATIGGVELQGIVLDGSKAVATWKRIRNASHDIGLHPVIMGELKEIPGYIADAAEINPEPIGEILKSAKRIHIPEWITKKVELDSDFLGAVQDEEWPSENIAESETFTVPFSIRDGKPLREVAIAFVPTGNAEAIPAYLRFGNWNDCPAPDVHVAFAAYWKERYGAEIVCATSDVLEMIVTRKPTTRHAAVALAREQYIYCMDIVEQGVGSISNLAALLMKSTSWYFWWD